MFFGRFEVALLVMAWRAAPGVAPIVHQARDLPLGNPGYLYLLAANLGTSVIPWVLFIRLPNPIYRQPDGTWPAPTE